MLLSFLFFCFIPKFIHFGQRHVFKRLTLRDGIVFHIIETANKLLVCQLERIVWIKMIEACRIDQTEQEIAKFLRCIFLVTLAEFCLQLTQFPRCAPCPVSDRL